MPLFANPYPKAHEKESPIRSKAQKPIRGESPMKSKAQRPTKKTEEQEMSIKRNARESDLQQNANLQHNIDLPQNTIF